MSLSQGCLHIECDGLVSRVSALTWVPLCFHARAYPPNINVDNRSLASWLITSQLWLMVQLIFDVTFNPLCPQATLTPWFPWLREQKGLRPIPNMVEAFTLPCLCVCVCVCVCDCVQVVSVDFHPYYRNEKQVVRTMKYFTNYVTATCPESVFAQSYQSINEVIGYCNFYATIMNCVRIWKTLLI